MKESKEELEVKVKERTQKLNESNEELAQINEELSITIETVSNVSPRSTNTLPVVGLGYTAVSAISYPLGTTSNTPPPMFKAADKEEHPLIVYPLT